MMNMMYSILRPLIFLQDPEKAHERIITAGLISQKINLTGLIETFYRYEDPRLNTSVCGIDFENPVGLAAGFDKNGILTRFFESLGFGFEEAGSATALGGDGNPKKRLFRLVQDEAIINRMGLNNQGVYSINENLKKRKSKFPIGVNIAKTHSEYIMGEGALQDFIDSYRLMDQGDYVVLNISCPNTKEGKTFEDPSTLEELLYEIVSLRVFNSDKRPLFVKLSPDVSDKLLNDILQVCEDADIDGYVVSNTSSGRQGLSTPYEIIEKIGKGGLSGKPIRERSTNMISVVYKETRKPIIGVGGIFTANDSYDKIIAGASLVEIYTGMVYQGPGIVKEIKKGLVGLLERDGFDSISQAVGKTN